MYRFNPGLPSLFLLALTGLLMASACSGGEDDSNEFVQIHVYNGYPGSNSLTVYGPTGPIVSNLPFGARTDAPILVNRNLGTEFNIILDGTPDAFSFAPELFDLYPFETATIFVGNRRGVNSLDINFLRHVQSISPFCRIVFSNHLAVNNSGLANFNFFPAWYFDGPDLALSGYDSSFENQFLDILEDLLPADINIGPVRDARRTALAFVSNYPYFALATQEDANEVGRVIETADGELIPLGSAAGTLQFVWVGMEDVVELPRVDYQSGRILTLSNSLNFVECMFDQAESVIADAGAADGDPPEFEQCLLEEEYSTRVVSPGDTEQVWYHFAPSLVNRDIGSNSCDGEIRLFSDFANIFVGDHGYTGWRDNNRFDIRTSNFTQSEHYFIVLYGYPVEPRVAEWTTSHPNFGFGPLGNYP